MDERKTHCFAILLFIMLSLHPMRHAGGPSESDVLGDFALGKEVIATESADG